MITAVSCASHVVLSIYHLQLKEKLPSMALDTDSYALDVLRHANRNTHLKHSLRGFKLQLGQIFPSVTFIALLLLSKYKVLRQITVVLFKRILSIKIIFRCSYISGMLNKRNYRCGTFFKNSFVYSSRKLVHRKVL
jgi:hypothetical protein